MERVKGAFFLRVILQRVSHAAVEIEGETVGKIGVGILVLVAVHQEDTEQEIEKMADKVAGLRIFEDEEGKMNRSLAEVGGALLVVSNFTLYSDCKKGRRPSFFQSARSEKAIPLYKQFLHCLRATGLSVQCGEFGADMQVSLTNDGPVTLVLDTDQWK